MRKARLLAAGIATVAMAGVMLQMPPANAHYRAIYQGRDLASIGDDHKYGSVCDREVDGHYVYAQWTDGYNKRSEADGGDRGCDTAFFYLWLPQKVRLCESLPGRKDACTSWRAA